MSDTTYCGLPDCGLNRGRSRCLECDKARAIHNRALELFGEGARMAQYAIVDRPAPKRRYSTHFAGKLAYILARHLEMFGARIGPVTVDQHQSNGLYGAKQFRVTLTDAQPHEQPVYRVIVVPADAQVSIGGVHADQHFAEPLDAYEAQRRG